MTEVEAGLSHSAAAPWRQPAPAIALKVLGQGPISLSGPRFTQERPKMPPEPSARNATQHQTIDVDDSRFPLVVASFLRAPTHDDRTAFRAGLERVLLRREKHAIIVDLTLAGGMTAVQRMQQAAWLHQHRELCRTWTVSAAFVVSSLLARGTLTAIAWLEPPTHPHCVTATLNEAERWTMACLQKAGLSVPAARVRT